MAGHTEHVAHRGGEVARLLGGSPGGAPVHLWGSQGGLVPRWETLSSSVLTGPALCQARLVPGPKGPRGLTVAWDGKWQQAPWGGAHPVSSAHCLPLVLSGEPEGGGGVARRPLGDTRTLSWRLYIFH